MTRSSQRRVSSRLLAPSIVFSPRQSGLPAASNQPAMARNLFYKASAIIAWITIQVAASPFPPLSENSTVSGLPGPEFRGAYVNIEAATGLFGSSAHPELLRKRQLNCGTGIYCTDLGVCCLSTSTCCSRTACCAPGYACSGGLCYADTV